MSHIVVYQSVDGSSGFEPCTSLDAAIVAAERMRNVDGVELPRIFKMEEVQFDFRPYFRVEVSGQADADFSSLSAGAMSSLASAPAPADPSSSEDTSSSDHLVPESEDVSATSEWPDFETASIVDAHDESVESVESVSSIDGNPFASPDPSLADDSSVDDISSDPTTDEEIDSFAVASAEPADLSAPLEHSVSAMGTLGSVESLNKLQESVEAFATNVDHDSDSIETLPPPPMSAADAEIVGEIEEPEPTSDPLVSVRRGLFGR